MFILRLSLLFSAPVQEERIVFVKVFEFELLVEILVLVLLVPKKVF